MLERAALAEGADAGARGEQLAQDLGDDVLGDAAGGRVEADAQGPALGLPDDAGGLYAGAQGLEGLGAGGELDEELAVLRGESGDVTGLDRDALLHEGGLVADGLQLLQVVRGDDDRLRAALAADQGAQVVGVAWVEAGGGLVEEDEVGAAEESLGDADTLDLSVREGAGATLAELAEVDEAEHAGGLALGGGGVHALQAAEEHEVLAHGDVAAEQGVLRERAEATLEVAGVGRAAEDLDLAAVGPEIAAAQAEEGGLAGAVGADQREDGAAWDLEVRAAQRVHVAEALVDLIEVEGELGHGR